MNVVETVMWQWIPRTGLERCELIRASSHWTLRGTILCAVAGGAFEARYEIRCDHEWNTLSTDVVSSDGRSVHVIADRGRWLVDDREAPQLAGCRDIDLGWSPSTNTVAIRRLKLPVGASSGPLTMAWVRFPELTVEPLGQAYQRLADRTYQYTSRDGGFRAALTIDEHDLVIDYEGIWKRV